MPSFASTIAPATTYPLLAYVNVVPIDRTGANARALRAYALRSARVSMTRMPDWPHLELPDCPRRNKLSIWRPLKIAGLRSYGSRRELIVARLRASKQQASPASNAAKLGMAAQEMIQIECCVKVTALPYDGDRSILQEKYVPRSGGKS